MSVSNSDEYLHNVVVSLSDACVLSLDPDTANNRLTLSEGNTKATHGVQQSCPDLPQRFDVFSQVLCREGLTGCCYWEVEWSTSQSEDVAVGGKVSCVELGITPCPGV